MNVLTIEEANRMILPGRTKEEYQRDYDYIIDLARPRGLDKSKINFYCETHHIKCRCLGGTDLPENLINLSFLEHVICHILLYRLNSNNFKLLYAAVGMLNGWCNLKKEKNKIDFNVLLNNIDIESIIDLKEEAKYIKSKSVVCYTEQKEIIKIFKSGRDAQREFKLADGSISKAIKNKNKAGGYWWDYLDNFNILYPNNIEIFINSPIENDHVLIQKQKSNNSKVICYSLNSNRILKIFEKCSDISKFGFSKDLISHSLVKDSKRGNIAQGYRWCRESNWKYPEELEKYYINQSKGIINDVYPFSSQQGAVLVDNNFNILKVFSSVRILSKIYKGLNITEKLNLGGNDIILNTPYGIFIKVRRYVELFEDRWLGYLKHKQLTKQEKDETV